jgi:hypothetical protein
MCITVVPTGELLHPIVSMLVGDRQRISIFLLPDPPIELVHSMRAVPNRRSGIPVCPLGIFPEGEEPLEAVFAFGSVIDDLSFVESVLRWLRNDGDVVEFHDDGAKITR